MGRCCPNRKHFESVLKLSESVAPFSRTRNLIPLDTQALKRWAIVGRPWRGVCRSPLSGYEFRSPLAGLRMVATDAAKNGRHWRGLNLRNEHYAHHGCLFGYWGGLCAQVGGAGS